MKLLTLFSLFFIVAPQGFSAGADPLKRATFSMYCYWTGEAALGKLEGVKKTKIGSLNHKEVVEVLYDAKETNVKEMAETLKQHRSFYHLLHRTEAEKKTAQKLLSKGDLKSGSGEVRYIASKHSLKVTHPDLYKLNLTEKQAIKLNTWAHFGGKMPDVLTPEQKEKLK